jgi:hypothetical protein
MVRLILNSFSNEWAALGGMGWAATCGGEAAWNGNASANGKMAEIRRIKKALLIRNSYAPQFSPGTYRFLGLLGSCQLNQIRVLDHQQIGD